MHGLMPPASANAGAFLEGNGRGPIRNRRRAARVSSKVRLMDAADLVIVGGGAAGLAAAIAAAERTGGRHVALLDGAKTLGAKILVSGGGRCNVTHEAVSATDFFGNRRIIKNVLAAFSVRETIDWFHALGVELKREDTGKLFPTTDKARTVLNALLNCCQALDINMFTGHRVSRIEGGLDGRNCPQSFTTGAIHHRTLILATGGRSLPKSGSDGSGYALATTWSFGHRNGSCLGSIPIGR